jgi:hypothetical protein
MVDRKPVLEILQRMREAEYAAKRAKTTIDRAVWLSRARAFDEVYTELKGLGYAGR